MNLIKDKKGIEFYLPFLAVLCIVIFTWTTYTMTTKNLQDSEFKAGETAKYIIQIYDEAEHAWFYLDESAKVATESSFKKLCNNGGYSENSSCQKEVSLSGSEYVIWDTCPEFNPEKQFENQVKLDLRSILRNYRAYYKESYNGFTESYTQLINDLTIDSIEDNKINFKELNYYIEVHSGSTYKVKPFSKFDQPNLGLFYSLYNALASCDSKESCEAKIQGSTVTKQGTKLYVKVENEDCNIQFIVDKSKPIQGKASPFN